jgi:GNAT superfamily N-acetyltransferase
MNAMPAYSVHEGDVERDRDAVLAIWQGNLGRHDRMSAKYDWFYRDSPLGPPLLLLLRHDASGEWVGVASAGPRAMLLRGRQVVAGVLVDLAVVPAHRSLGPAMTLQQALIDAGRRRFDLLYGFPNPKAAAVFKRVGYAALGEMVRHARVLRHAPYLARTMPRWIAAPGGGVLDLIDRLRARARQRGRKGEWSDQVPDAVDTLWAGSDHGQGLVSVRAADFVHWRFDRSPLIDVRYLTVRDRSGVMLAWFACQAVDRTLHVRDAWSIAGVTGPGPDVLATLAAAARADGMESISMELLSHSRSCTAWRAGGFVERERRPVYGLLPDGVVPDGDFYLTSADEDE